MTERLPKEKKIELWQSYSDIWRKVLTRVLGWPEQRVDEYIETLRQKMEEEEKHWPHGFGFFYDSPLWYLFNPILGDGLYERIVGCRSEEANPVIVKNRLVEAITGGQNEWAMNEENFDWEAAHYRYCLERRRVEEWLKSLEERENE